jgi:polyisoprenoid-binding protein YceI
MSIAHSTERGSRSRSLVAGLAAGAVAALLASLLSLPLESPDDSYFNTATITLGAIVAGLGAGILWRQVQRHHNPLRDFLLGIVAAGLVVTAVTMIVQILPNAPFEGFAGFVLPLAGLVFGVVLLLTPVLDRILTRPVWLASATGAAVLAAAVVGLGLAGQGDAESGRLSLPPLPSPAAGTAASGPSAGAGNDDYGAGAPSAAAESTPANGGALSAPPGQGSGAVLRPADVAGVTFDVAPAESAATYTVRQKLASLPLPNDVVGRTNAVSGEVHLDGRPSTITVDLRTLDSGEPQRDSMLRERLGLPFNRFPFAELTLDSIPDLPAEYRSGETLKRSVTGSMKLRDVERPLTFEVEARMQDGVLSVVGRTDFTWSDFDIPTPNVAGFVQAEDNVHVEILVVARGDTGG